MEKRKTVQKSLVLDAVNKLHNHPTADEVYAKIKIDYPNISRATVYRDLKELCDNGELKKRTIPNSADRYDHGVHDHYHVICEKCGKVVDVDMEYMKDLEQSVKNSYGFKLTGHNVVFTGICKDCIDKENK